MGVASALVVSGSSIPEASTPWNECGLMFYLATSGVLIKFGGIKRGVGGADTVRRCDHRSRSCAIFFMSLLGGKIVGVIPGKSVHRMSRTRMGNLELNIQAGCV
jgi:hypothetical protein